MDVKTYLIAIDAVDKNGDMITNEAISKINLPALSGQVVLNDKLDPVGRILKVSVENHHLVALLRIRDRFNYVPDQIKVIPTLSYLKYRTEGNLRVVDEATIVQLTVSNKPPTQDLPKSEIIL